jgi:LDH2 family malate/lactate/ureidoglycolate dehydrogenase
VYRLLDCVRSIKADRVATDAEPVVMDAAPSWLRVDAGGAFSPLAFRRGLPLLIEKARTSGLAAMAINDCVHFSALWFEIEEIVAQKLVAFACTANHSWVAPAGGARPVLGTNPMAFGWPCAGREPFVFDFATSAIARGEIELCHRNGSKIPLGWAIDTDGNPTDDPGEALKGAMLTFGGHKGTALSIMIELLAGPLIGDLTSAESQAADGRAGALPIGGELIIAIDPESLLGEATPQYFEHAERLFSDIVRHGARLPSQRRYQARSRSLAEGVRIPHALYRDLRALLDGPIAVAAAVTD